MEIFIIILGVLLCINGIISAFLFAAQIKIRYRILETIKKLLEVKEQGLLNIGEPITNYDEGGYTFYDQIFLKDAFSALLQYLKIEIIEIPESLKPKILKIRKVKK